MRYTYFPKQELKFTHPENMFLSFSLDGWSVPRRTLGNARFWRCRQRSGRSDQSHRPAPNVEIGTYREKPPYPMLAGGLWSRHISIGRIWPLGNKACDGWKQPALLVTPEQHRVKDIYCVLGLLRSQQCKRQQFFSEVSHHGNSDSIFVMCCVSVPVLSEQNMSKPQSIRPRPMVVNKLNQAAIDFTSVVGLAKKLVPESTMA